MRWESYVQRVWNNTKGVQARMRHFSSLTMSDLDWFLRRNKENKLDPRHIKTQPNKFANAVFFSALLLGGQATIPAGNQASEHSAGQLASQPASASLSGIQPINQLSNQQSITLDMKQRPPAILPSLHRFASSP